MLKQILVIHETSKTATSFHIIISTPSADQLAYLGLTAIQPEHDASVPGVVVGELSGDGVEDVGRPS